MMGRTARYLLLCLCICACSQTPRTRATRFHSPLVSSVWEPLAPRRTVEPLRRSRRSREPEPSTESSDNRSRKENIRDQMVAGARALLNDESESGGFGARDLDALLTEVIDRIDWRADQGLDALVALAEKNTAYYTDGRPISGDIVLFHNQLDANGNGKADDWLTGCGVVVEHRGDRFDAVVRTGHRPRRISAWPNGSERRSVNGEVVNSFLRVPHRSDSSEVQYLAGSLYAGHIDIEELAAGRR